jgi:hypothetical protein
VLALALTTLGLAGCGTAQKAELDREVDRLCAIDGGMHIYETVALPKEDFGPDGEVSPKYRLRYPKGELGPNYIAGYQVRDLVAGNPSLQRLRVYVQRVAEGKTLGEFVDYKRSGGDGIGPGEPSRKSCPTSRDSGGFYKRIFVQEKRMRRIPETEP